MARRGPTDNHFISVSRAGVLMARRKGQAPVAITTVEAGLAIEPPGLPPMRIFFERSGRNRILNVIDFEVGGERLPIEAFFDRFGLLPDDLGRFMRAAVDAALDAAVDGEKAAQKADPSP